METGRTPMEEAEAQLYRRIQELRTRARGDQPVPDVVPESRPAMPDLRTILARAETHVDELRTTAASLCTRCRAIRSAERGPMPGSLLSAAINCTIGSGRAFIALP